MTGSAVSIIVIERTKCLRRLATRAVESPWLAAPWAFRNFRVTCTEEKAAKTCFHDEELWEVDGHLHGERLFQIVVAGAWYAPI